MPARSRSRSSISRIFGADNLSGTVSIGDGDLLTGLVLSFTAIAPGRAFDIAYVALTTTSGGRGERDFH